MIRTVDIMASLYALLCLGLLISASGLVSSRDVVRDITGCFNRDLADTLS